MSETDEANLELWPQGENKQLLHSMLHYFQHILQDHGTRLPEHHISKLYKVKEDMKSLLITLNNDTDYQIPGLNFTLPGIYKFYNNQNDQHEMDKKYKIVYNLQLKKKKNTKYIAPLKSIHMKQSYDPSTQQSIAIADSFKRNLIIYKNGTSELKKCSIDLNQMLISIPIKKITKTSFQIYLKTSSDLYLGSNEHGLLFLGNVTKHHQIWTVEHGTSSTYLFKNHYGLYLTGNKMGQVCANSRNKTNTEQFRVYSIGNRNRNRNSNRSVLKPPPPPRSKRKSLMIAGDPLMTELKSKLMNTKAKSVGIDDQKEAVKPALPLYPTKIVVKKIRSKYQSQRPLPAVPHNCHKYRTDSDCD